MWTPKTQSAIALMLLLTSCGAEAASLTEPSRVVESAPSPTIPATTIPATTIPASPDSTVADKKLVAASFPARLALTTKDGQVVTFSSKKTPIVTEGLPAPMGDVVVSTSTHAGRTTVEWRDVSTNQISASVQIDGEFSPSAVAQDGKLVALIGSAGTSTTVVLATPSNGEMRRWTFDAVLVPEAFSNAFDPAGDGLPIGVFVIEYLAADIYRVRVIDTATGQLGLPLNLRDKTQSVDEIMTAVSRTAVFEPNNQLLFTLYQDATEGGENVGSFIHTLGLVNGVWCLDVPAELGLADHPGALAVNPAGSRLFAASTTGGVAGYEVSDVLNIGPEMPEARTTTALPASAERVAIAASQDEVVLALGSSLFRLDPVTLAVRDSFTWDMDVEALTVLDGGSIVIVGTGRMTLVSADNQIVDEAPIGKIGEVIRVAVIG